MTFEEYLLDYLQRVAGLSQEVPHEKLRSCVTLEHLSIEGEQVINLEPEGEFAQAIARDNREAVDKWHKEHPQPRLLPY